MKLVSKNNITYLDSGKLEVYTLQRYLGSSSRIDGERVIALGFCTYKFYDKITDKKPSKVGVFNNPSLTTFYPVDIEQNAMDYIWDGIYKNPNENEYMKLTFEGGSRVHDQFGVKSLDNSTIFTELLLSGRLDNNIPYQYLAPGWIKNLVMNGVNLSVPAPVINMIVSDLCRYKGNSDKKYAHAVGKDPSISPVEYVFGNIREICASNSVYAALSFEDMNSMLDASLNMTAQGKSQTISPVEQIMYM